MKNEIRRKSGLFSKEEGLEIQKEQILKWGPKLSEKIFAALAAEKDRRNSLLNENSSGYDVWRGTSIDEFIANWTPKELNLPGWEFAGEKKQPTMEIEMWYGDSHTGIASIQPWFDSTPGAIKIDPPVARILFLDGRKINLPLDGIRSISVSK